MNYVRKKRVFEGFIDIPCPKRSHDTRKCLNSLLIRNLFEIPKKINFHFRGPNGKSLGRGVSVRPSGGGFTVENFFQATEV